MMIKYRVREVAKDLDIPNKDVLDTLSKYFPEPKKYMTALEENELDVVFETFTQQRSVDNLDAYFAERGGSAVPAVQPAPAPAAAAKPAQQQKTAQPRGEKRGNGAAQNQNRPQQRQQAAPQQQKPAQPQNAPQGSQQPVVVTEAVSYTHLTLPTN